MSKKSVCLKVPRTRGEETLEIANRLSLTHKGLQIRKDESGSLCIPLNHEPSDEEKAVFKEKIPEFTLGTNFFTEKRQPEKNLAEILKGELSPQLLTILPRALDVVGDIAIIEISHELEPHKIAIGAAIMKTHRSVRVVLAKAGAISGTYRLRKFDFIAGEHRTNTLYKEYGCSYYLDVAKAYFSPRLSREHERVAMLVQRGETVVDLFAGVGPFAVLVAKKVQDSKVYAIDINVDAFELLKKNVRLNRVENRVLPFLGDARQIVNESLSSVADRVIMNLPETANEFVDVACRALKPKGGMVHFYGFVRLPRTLKDLKTSFIENVKKSGRKVLEFKYGSTVRATAPYEYQTVLDAQIR
jgi:tRNA (guanine37-N1)-methyltransferase